MKKLIAMLLAVLMLLTLVACGGKDDVEKSGALHVNMSGLSDEHFKHIGDDLGFADVETVEYNNLSTALMDLESGKIQAIGLEACIAKYIAAHNENIIAEFTSSDRTNFSMMTMDTNTEVYDILNNAIKAMKEDGTLDSLIANELEAYINSDPTPKALPHFDGAKTIKIGVTGDMPPMDFVAANGEAAGFNIALLTEIANRAQVNIELVQIETGSRPMALSSGKVDAVFWTKSITCTECNGTWNEEIKGTLVTESYFSDNIASVKLKDNK